MTVQPVSEAERAASHRGPKDERGVILARITAAALTSFAEQGWAATTMRSVARDAGVDPSLLRYYFTSKEALLQTSMVFPVGFLERIRAVADAPLPDRGEALVRVLLANWSDPHAAEILRAGLNAAAQVPLARDRIEQLFRAEMMPLVAGLSPNHRRERAALVASHLVGLALTRYVWNLEPLRSMSDRRIVRYVGPTIQRYLAGEV